ncbi:hypothetical protein P3S68_019735 [Capsicum galapagoense]
MEEQISGLVFLLFQIQASFKFVFIFGLFRKWKNVYHETTTSKGIKGYFGAHSSYLWKPGLSIVFSFFEIYGGKLFDLLNDRKKLYIREDGKQQVCIVGLQEYRVSDVEMIKEIIDRGNATTSTGTIGANEESSRSHAIL